MSSNPSRQNREEIRELLKQYQNLRAGRSHSFLDEDAFEKIIDYYDDLEDLVQAIEAAERGIEQYPYSSALLIKKADLFIASRRYKESLHLLEQAELLDSGNIHIYILMQLQADNPPGNCEVSCRKGMTDCL